MSRGGTKRSWRNALALLAIAAAMVAGGCAGSGSSSVEYSYGVHYGSVWGYDDYYYGGPIYVGPPGTVPPPDVKPPRPDARPPQASHLPARPMPPPRPAPRAGGGRRR